MKAVLSLWAVLSAFMLFGSSPARAGDADVFDVEISGASHPLGSALRAVVYLPQGADSANPVPGCVIAHGSGGLFKANDPGDACGPQLESNYRELAELFSEHGVASILPSSFASRDNRFCEDNDDDYLAYAPAPFFNPGDGPIVRDEYYKMRRVAIRTIDLLVASEHLCSMEEIDCERTCLVGTSAGATGILGYVANDVERHLAEFLNLWTQRTHESAGNYQDRQAAFANFPPVLVSLSERLANRPLPRFAQAISPGCTLRKLIPTVEPEDGSFDPDLHAKDLYYPAADLELHLDIGTADDVPEACYDGGIREVQARAYELLTDESPSRYLVQTYDGAGHGLLDEVGGELHSKLRGLVYRHFFGTTFRDGFEGN